MAIATIGGVLHCGMCGGHGSRVLTLVIGEVYDCPRCREDGTWDGFALRALPWWAPPRGLDAGAWIAAMREVDGLSPDFGDAPAIPSNGRHPVLRARSAA